MNHGKGCLGPDMSAQGDDLAANREMITLSNQWPEPTVGVPGWHKEMIH